MPYIPQDAKRLYGLQLKHKNRYDKHHKQDSHGLGYVAPPPKILGDPIKRFMDIVKPKKEV